MGQRKQLIVVILACPVFSSSLCLALVGKQRPLEATQKLTYALPPIHSSPPIQSKSLCSSKSADLETLPQNDEDILEEVDVAIIGAGLGGRNGHKIEEAFFISSQILH